MLSNFLFKFSHYKTTLSCRSDLNVNEKGWHSEVFKESSSGTAKRVRSSRASKEPDSSTRPGMSLLVAIHTSASLSHVKSIVYSMIEYLLTFDIINVSFKNQYVSHHQYPYDVLCGSFSSQKRLLIT